MLKNIQNVACIKFNDKVPLSTKLTLYIKKNCLIQNSGLPLKNRKHYIMTLCKPQCNLNTFHSQCFSDGTGGYVDTVRNSFLS